MSYNQLSNPEKWIIKGIPALFIIGSFLHFAYEFSGNLLWVGAFAPVNESIWEHLKLAMIPMVLWFGIYYVVKSKRYNINKNKWYSANLASLVIYMLFSVSFYYTYTEAFGFKSLFMDILDFFLSIMAGQFTALKIYKKSRTARASISILLIGLLVFTFVIFTFYPPHIPLFMDMNKLKYGI